MKYAAWLADPIGHKQLDGLDVSDSQTGVPWCMVRSDLVICGHFNRSFLLYFTPHTRRRSDMPRKM